MTCCNLHTYDIICKENNGVLKDNIYYDLARNYDKSDINKYTYRSIIGSKYIISGYRMNYSFFQTLLSLFSIHNETINIWTHLIPVFINIVLIYSNPSTENIIFLVGTLPIFLFSGLFHLFLPLARSLYHYHFFIFFDLLGITLGITSIETYIYYKYIHNYTIYFFLFCIFNNLLCIIPFFQYQTNVTKLRNKCILNLFMITLSILFTLLLYIQPNITVILRTLPPLLIINTLFILSFKKNLIEFFPEKYIERKFDIFGSSHQLWHLIVNIYIYGLFLIL
jgi:adiponectin receptor